LVEFVLIQPSQLIHRLSGCHAPLVGFVQYCAELCALLIEKKLGDFFRKEVVNFGFEWGHGIGYAA
jgi:hypothetical protein